MYTVLCFLKRNINEWIVTLFTMIYGCMHAKTIKHSNTPSGEIVSSKLGENT